VENRLLKKTENSKIKTAKRIQNVKHTAKGQNDYELRHISPAWHGQRSVQNNPCSKHTQPLEQTALPLQVQIRSCKKSDDICTKCETHSKRTE
jgi:hypothetical protein